VDILKFAIRQRIKKLGIHKVVCAWAQYSGDEEHNKAPDKHYFITSANQDILKMFHKNVVPLEIEPTKSIYFIYNNWIIALCDVGDIPRSEPKDFINHSFIKTDGPCCMTKHTTSPMTYVPSQPLKKVGCNH
jgi:hypothetical protein